MKRKPGPLADEQLAKAGAILEAEAAATARELAEFATDAEEINAAAADMAREIEAFHRGAQKDKRFLRPPKSERPECGAMTRTGRPCRARVVWNTGEREPKTRCGNTGD